MRYDWERLLHYWRIGFDRRLLNVGMEHVKYPDANPKDRREFDIGWFRIISVVYTTAVVLILT